MTQMTPEMRKIFERVFSDHGYRLDEYVVDVRIFSAENQLIIIHRDDQHIEIPVEANVLDWPWRKMAEVIVDGIDDHNIQEKGYI